MPDGHSFILGYAPTPRRPDAPRRKPLSVPVDYSLHARAAPGDIMGQRWGFMLGWEPVSGTGGPPGTTYTFDTGLTLTGASVNLDPARTTEIGGITEPATDGLFLRRAAAGVFTWAPATAGTAYIWGTALTEAPPGTINVDPATPTVIGAIMEPPDGALTYVRQYLGGVGTWVASTGTGYTWGIGLNETPLGSGNIDLIPATPTVIGGVSVVARSATQGLDLAASGALTGPLATDLLAGTILEPLPDGLQYVRTRTAAGVSSWVAATVANFIWGIGIDEDTTTPGTINLIPATALELGGVTVQARSATQGLALDPLGDLAAPIATPALAGVLTEPPADDGDYIRRTAIATGASTWVRFSPTSSYKGRWQVAANVPPLTATSNVNGDYYLAETVDPLVGETAPASVPGIGGTTINNGDLVIFNGGLSVWDHIPRAQSNTWGIGLDESATVALQIDLRVANLNGEIGGVMTVVRDATQALDMTAAGLITVPLATDLLAGGIVEPLPDDLLYVRTRTVAGVSSWVMQPPGADFGTGLAVDRTATPPIVNLTPAGDAPAFLGGVYVVDRVRNNTEGLELGIDGRLRVPPATDALLGGILEPPPDDKGYVRRRTAAGISAWVPPADPAPAPLAIEFIIPNTVQVGSAPQTVEVHGTKFTAATTVNFGTATPAVTFVSETELTFDIDPALETVRTLSVTINDSGLPGQGDAPFYFRAADKLYQGTWQPVTNTPDILTPPKGNGWMWIADTVDPRVEDLVPMTIPGIAGMKIREGDHVVWDAAAAAFTLVASARALAVTDIVPSQMLLGAPTLQAHVYGAGFTATTEVLWEGVPIATQFLDENKLRITVDQATMVPTSRGFVVVGVQDGAVAGNGAAGFQFVEKIDVQPAGDTKPEIGVVFVPARTGMQALTLTVDGMLTSYLATPQLAGTITEPPADDKGYVRQTRTAGGSSWVPPALTPLPEAGIGLTFDGTTPPGVVNLDIANTNGEIGGVITVGRGPTQGLDLDMGTGLLTAPLATDVAAGSIVEPPADGAIYSRQRTTAGVSSWVPGAAGVFIGDDPPPAPTAGMLWFESDTGDTHVWYADIDSGQWVQI